MAVMGEELKAVEEDTRLMLDERDAYARRKEMETKNITIKSKGPTPHSLSNRAETLRKVSKELMRRSYKRINPDIE